jgi:tetratricopeptide (TPR) repeat protein
VTFPRRALLQRLGLGLCAFSALLFAPTLEDAYVLPQRLALSLGCVLLVLGAPAGLRLGRLAWAVLVWLAWRVLCRVWTEPPGSFVSWLADQAPLWALTLFAGSALETAEQRQAAGAVLLAAGAFGSVAALLPMLGWDPWAAGAVDIGFAGRAHGTLGNPDFLGGWLVLLLPLSLAVTLAAKRRARALALAATALIALALWRTEVRASWLAAAVGVLAVLGLLRPALFTRSVVRVASTSFVAALAIALVIPGLLPERLREAANPRSDAWGSRAFMGHAAVAMAVEHPLTGVGPGGFGDAFLRWQGAQLSAGAHEPYRFTYDAHNDWLQIAAECGWLGLLLWTVLWAGALREAWRFGGATGAALAGALLAFGVQGCFHFPWAVWPSAALILLALAAVSALREPQGPSLPAMRPLWLVLLLASIVLGWRQAASSAALNAGHVAERVPQVQAWAGPLFGKAAELRPDDARAWQSLGANAQREGHWDPAIAAYHRALQLQPSQADLWVDLGLALGQQGSLDAAEPASQQGLALNPNSTQAWINASKVAWLRGDTARAEGLLRQALQRNGPSAQASFNLGAILYNGRRFKEAAAAFQAVLVLEPGHAEALRLLKDCQRAR